MVTGAGLVPKKCFHDEGYLIQAGCCWSSSPDDGNSFIQRFRLSATSKTPGMLCPSEQKMSKVTRGIPRDPLQNL